ncbi:M12 family metallo-peptidase, partial [Bacteriovoracaceae bacterium]|nr:M12 family metallo-peptidase [Bacteriovoracaceae bacterium]
NLFDDMTVTAIVKKKIEKDQQRFTWVGTIEGDPWGTAIISVNGEKVSGHIDADNRSFSIRPMGKGVHFVYEYKDNHALDLKNDIADLPSVSSNTILEEDTVLGAGDDGTVIDILVGYTADSFAATADIDSEIATDIAYTNDALAKSCVNFRYNLVHAQQYTYTETGNMNTDLTALANTSDGEMDDIHDDRVTYGADLVQLWVQTNRDYCGLAYAPSLISLNSAYGFSVKLRACASATTAHELGHNLSLIHDRYEGGIGLKDYTVASNYGYVNTMKKIGTIQTYTTECSAYGFSCTRVSYYSNPRVLNDGMKLGIPAIADSASNLNLARTTVAAYQTSTITSTPDLTGCTATPDENENLTSCFIATAAFGSYLDPHVLHLRHFRDNMLMSTPWGQKIVSWYYKVSPTYAKKIQHNHLAKNVVKAILSPIIYILSSPVKGFFTILLLWISIHGVLKKYYFTKRRAYS